MAIALIMAGGQSLRMRASRGPRHKALVQVLGVSMLERNVLALLAHGFRKIAVAVSAQERTLISFAEGRATLLARAGGARLKVYIEKQPLGTIGAAKTVPGSTGDLLVVNVDNLSSLDLTALLSHHRKTKAAMTIATHNEPFPVPFGQVKVRAGRIVGYKEKPILPVLLSSGTYVLSPAARESIPSHRPVGAPELVNILLREKQKVSAFSHSSHWIDVNDSVSVERAEVLIMSNFASFELFRECPQREFAVLAVLNGGKFALAKSETYQAAPGRRQHMEFPVGTATLQDRMGWKITRPELIASFDELDSSGKRTRNHIFACQLAEQRSQKQFPTDNGLRWMNVSQRSNSHAQARTIAYLARYIASQNPHSVGH